MCAVLIVIPRAFSSGAASIWSYAFFSDKPLFPKTVVIAAVKVVLPWSTWPIVPMLTWVLLLSNFSFASVKIPPIIIFLTF